MVLKSNKIPISPILSSSWIKILKIRVWNTSFLWSINSYIKTVFIWEYVRFREVLYSGIFYAALHPEIAENFIFQIIIFFSMFFEIRGWDNKEVWMWSLPRTLSEDILWQYVFIFHNEKNLYSGKFCIKKWQLKNLVKFA